MTIETDPNFWDCECATRFIHPKTEKTCPLCGSYEEDQPDSRPNEIAKPENHFHFEGSN